MPNITKAPVRHGCACPRRNWRYRAEFSEAAGAAVAAPPVKVAAENPLSAAARATVAAENSTVAAAFPSVEAAFPLIDEGFSRCIETGTPPQKKAAVG